MVSFESFQKKAKKISSLSGQHVHILYGLVRWLCPTVAVEVGAYQGGSSIWIARALQENNHGMLYCIDDFSMGKNSPSLLYKNLCSCGVEEKTHILIGKSTQVIWPDKVDFAFIDSDFIFESCQHDVNRAISLGASCIVIHATTAKGGPRRWIEQFYKEQNREWEALEVAFDGGLAILMKKPKKVQLISALPSHVLNFVSNFLPHNPIVLECGGHEGEDTTLMALHWPESTIYTFEPFPQLFELLKKRTASHPNIKPYPLALADTNEKMTFYLSDYGNSGHPSGSSSLLPPKEHLTFDANITFNGNIQVNAVKLDDWAATEEVSHIDFMWLDMQGYELNMLKASRLAKKSKIIYLEVEFVEAYTGQYLYPDIKKWMTENNFELIALDFDERIAMAGRELIKPGLGYPYFGNAIFLNRNHP